MKKTIVLLLLIIVGCKSTPQQNSEYTRYEMEDFSLDDAKAFVSFIDTLGAIESVSVIEYKKHGKEFDVNGQHIFTDVTYVDKPNFYNYKKRAQEINLDPDVLLKALNLFHNTKASSYIRAGDLYIFKVVSYWNIEKGYIYSKSKTFNVGDYATYYKNTNRSLYIEKQTDTGWYVYSDPKQ